MGRHSAFNHDIHCMAHSYFCVFYLHFYSVRKVFMLYLYFIWIVFVLYLTGGGDKSNLEPAVTIYSPGWNSQIETNPEIFQWEIQMKHILKDGKGKPA